MKVSQKLLAALLSLAMLFSLAGCGLDSIVSDSPTSISDASTDSESSIIDDSSETAGLTETVDEGSESNKQGLRRFFDHFLTTNSRRNIRELFKLLALSIH